MRINSNLLAASTLVIELAELGVSHAIIGAGSRSTPLTIAFAMHSDILAISQIDERSAGFMALGIGQVTKDPVVLVCTSGTAAGNFYPAILEAHESNVPLIVITADRPHILRDSGANQTMDQTKLYGDYAEYFVDVKTPPEDINPKYIRYLRNIAYRAFSQSLYPTTGPTHINFPFAKPLEPTKEELQEIKPEKLVEQAGFQSLRKPYISYQQGKQILDDDTLEELTLMIENAARPVLICGPKTSDSIKISQINKLIEKTSIICFPDGVSGIRYKNQSSKYMICTYETFFQHKGINALPSPDLIIQIGQMPISKYLTQYLETIDEVPKIYLTTSPKIEDSTLKTSHVVVADPTTTISSIMGKIDTDNIKRDNAWIDQFRKVNEHLKSEINDFLLNNPNFEPSVISRYIEQLPDKCNLILASSLPVRHLDQFICEIEGKEINVYANRGISGIDGTISTCMGISLVSELPTYLIIGDLAFYHDMNGLLVSTRYDIDIGILIINNSGGVIFDRLPIKKFDPPFNEFFLTKHDIEYEQIAHHYDYEYTAIDTADQLSNPQINEIIEFKVRPQIMEQIREEMTNDLLDKIDQHFDY